MAEVVTFIEESLKTGAELPTFRLADLAKIYTSALEQLGKKTTAKLNTYHLKERIVHQVPSSLEYFNKGCDVYLVFHEDIGNVLQNRQKEDLDDEGMHLAKAAAIIRKDILGNQYLFNGSFDENCQVRSVPQSLLSFLKMILLGQNINDQAESVSRGQAALTIAQLVQFNTYVHHREEEVKRERRNKSRESPLPIYVGLSIHAKTRSCDLDSIKP